jgi:uncharacterized protein YdhG (YjbR/CyaY superfamily)
MQTVSSGITTIDHYIQRCPEHIRDRLRELRATIKRAAPNAVEKISYRMPTFYYHGNLVHFAAFARHIGFYPTPSGIEAFKSELRHYKNAKGSVQFPIDEPLPLELIGRIVRFRVEENAEGRRDTRVGGPPTRPHTMNLAELRKRFEIVGAKVADRVSDAGQNPSAVLSGRLGQFKLRLMTVSGSRPKYWRMDLRKPLQTSRTDDEIADQVVRLWRLQMQIDEGALTARFHRSQRQRGRRMRGNRDTD